MENIEITRISMKINAGNKPVKAFASIVFNNSLKINGIRIVERKSGNLIVVFPEYPEKEIQYVVPISHQLRSYIDQTLVDRYLKLRKALNKNATKGFDQNG